MSKITSFFISFFLIFSLSFIPNKAEAGLRTKAFIAASGFVATKVIKKALTSPKTREWFLNNTIKNPEFKKKAISVLNDFIKNPKFAKYKDDAKILLDQVKNKLQSLPKPFNTTKLLRNKPGTAWGTSSLSRASPQVWKNSIMNEGASIPFNIGQKLSGRNFNKFDDFRKAFWNELSKDKNFLKQFDKSGQSALKSGKAPFTSTAGHAGKRGRFELHHKKPLENGGAVYSMDNLIIVTPKKHIELHKLLGKG
tara:strand:+ start:3418 stop:4173 length:756 start_codon:yes stop_codon:yes gene_type:complete